MVNFAAMHRTKPYSNAAWLLMLPAALLTATLWLTGCGVDGSDPSATCPPVVQYTQDDQATAAKEVEALQEGAVIVRMLSDYAVLRDQARACR